MVIKAYVRGQKKKELDITILNLFPEKKILDFSTKEQVMIK